MTQFRKIRVLVVDDSALVRRLARDTLNADPEIEVVGAAADPYEARDQIVRLSPDVLTLDLAMPRMDGLTFLKLLMESRPMPVVVMSSLTAGESDYAYEAIRLGAVDVIGKPSGSFPFAEAGPQLVAKVKAAARARLGAGGPGSADPLRPTPGARLSFHADPDPRSLILLGASTGGIQALQAVLSRLPPGLPGIAIVQHIPAVFSKTFAERLDQACAFRVREAADGDRLGPGIALVAPGNRHLQLAWDGEAYEARVTASLPVGHQRPSVDVLFRSAAHAGAGPHCVAGVLTGMGADGAAGLLELRERGAATFAQDEASSVVYGMPRAARENGGAGAVVPLNGIASFLIQSLSRAPRPLAATP